MKYKASLASVALAVSTIVLVASSITSAQQSGVANGFKVSPVRTEVTVDKGKSTTQKIYVTNVNSYPVTAKAIINDFEASTDESGKPQIILDENKSASSNSFKSLVTPIPDITLEPGKAVEIPVVITIPGDAQAGGYYGAVRFVSAETETPGQKNVALSASVGSIFLVRVPGELTEQLQLVDFSAGKDGSTSRFFTNGSKLEVITRLKNTGNIHVAPFGRVQISDRSGKIVEEFEFNSETPKANILPNSTRKFTDTLKKQNYLGKYTVIANLGYGTTGSLITAQSTFWVIPLWMIITAAVVLVGLIIGGFLLYRRFSNNKKHKTHTRR